MSDWRRQRALTLSTDLWLNSAKRLFLALHRGPPGEEATNAKHISIIMHRNSISLLLYVVHIGSCVLLLTFGARAISIDNVHVSQPILRRSPATNNPDDMFGFATIMHQIEVVDARDSLEVAAGKTRLEQSPNY